LSVQQQIREAAESDLLQFIKYVAPNIMLGHVHEELISWWTREGARPHQLVMLPRGHQKSRLLALRCLWTLTKDPTATFLYISATADLAEKQLFYMKNILGSRRYLKIWPEMCHPDEGKRAKWTTEEIILDHPAREYEGIRDPSIKACGITANVTGLHCTHTALDDLVVPKNAYTEDGRRNVRNLYSQLASVEEPDANEWVVGTRYHPSDIYADMLAMTELVYDDEGIPTDEREVYEKFAHERVETDGEFLWPRMPRNDGKFFGFDFRVLATIKAKYLDRTQYYAQYYGNPNDPHDQAIEAALFQYYDSRFLTQEGGVWWYKDRRLNIFAAVDFAYSRSKKADYTAICVIGVDVDKNIYVLEIDRFKTDSIMVYFDNIKRMYMKWGFSKIRAEVNAAQQVIVKQLKEHFVANALMISVDEHRPSRHDGDKEERIATALEPLYGAHKVWHYKGGNCQLLEYELVNKRPAHDDMKDVLASATAIAVPPRRRARKKKDGMKLNFNSRFGGVQYGSSLSR
jgi:hypothetical protein